MAQASGTPRTAAATRKRSMTTRKTSRSAPIDPWLQELWDRKGTDLLLTAGAPPLLRIDGQLQPYDSLPALTPTEVDKLV